MQSKWSHLISKSSISDFLIEDALNENPSGIPDDVISSLKIVVENKKDLKQIKKSISNLKPFISKELYSEISNEFKEIKEDLKWIGTERGHYILAINDWVQLFHSEFNSIDEFKKVLIGGHTEKMVVFVTGEVQNEKFHNTLLEYMNGKNPPFKVFTKIKINDA